MRAGLTRASANAMVGAFGKLPIKKLASAICTSRRESNLIRAPNEQKQEEDQ